MRLKAALKSKPSSTQTSETDRNLRKVLERPCSHAPHAQTSAAVRALTVHSQGEVTAVKLVLGGDLTSVGSSEVHLGCQDLHLKRVDLRKVEEHGVPRCQQGARLGFWASESRGLTVGHLGVAVVRLFQLQVFSGLAGEIHPLPFEPFHGGLLQQRLFVHFGHKGDVLTCPDEADLIVIAFARISANTLEAK